MLLSLSIGSIPISGTESITVNVASPRSIEGRLDRSGCAAPMRSNGQNDVSALRENLFRLSEVDLDNSHEIVFSLPREIETSVSIDLHYTGHEKEKTIGDQQLLLLIAAMHEADLSKLQVLNLSGSVLEDQNIFTTLAALLTMADLTSLQYLDLSGNYSLTEDGSAALASALRSGRFGNLKHLGLPRCNIGNMVDAIQEGNIWQLNDLIFSGRGATEELRYSNVHKLFEAGLMTKLKKLVMKGQSVDSRGMVAFAKALHYHPGSRLQTLDLSSNSIGDVGSFALARLIQDANLVNLHHLRLSSCFIDGEQMETIIQGIESGFLCNLEHLDVSRNKFKDQGALAISRAIKGGHLPSLRRLNLGYCEIGTEFQRRHGILAIFEALGEGQMEHLEWLNLLGNEIGQGAAMTVANTIVETLEMTPALRFINLFDSRHGNPALKEALELVLRYPVAEFKAVYSGLKRKTNTEFLGPISNHSRRISYPKDRQLHEQYAYI